MCTFCDHPFILHPLPPTFPALLVVSAGLWKQVGQGTKELRKEIALPVKCECVRKSEADMRHSVCMRKPFIQRNIFAADYIQAGGDVSDLVVCCCGGLCMQLLLSACVSPLLLRGRL